MRQGYVRLRGQWAAWAGVLAVNFEAGDDTGEGSELLPRTLFRSHERAAHCCVRCEAVLVEPKSGAYVPPDDAAPDDRATAEPEAGAESIESVEPGEAADDRAEPEGSPAGGLEAAHPSGGLPSPPRQGEPGGATAAGAEREGKAEVTGNGHGDGRAPGS